MPVHNNSGDLPANLLALMPQYRYANEASAEIQTFFNKLLSDFQSSQNYQSSSQDSHYRRDVIKDLAQQNKGYFETTPRNDRAAQEKLIISLLNQAQTRDINHNQMIMMSQPPPFWVSQPPPSIRTQKRTHYTTTTPRHLKKYPSCDSLFKPMPTLPKMVSMKFDIKDEKTDDSGCRSNSDSGSSFSSGSELTSDSEDGIRKPLYKRAPNCMFAPLGPVVRRPKTRSRTQVTTTKSELDLVMKIALGSDEEVESLIFDFVSGKQ